MSWFTKNIVNNPFINLPGAIISKSNKGGATTRVDRYAETTSILGCGTPNGCSFTGTAADFEKYRRNWIDNCSSRNSGGFLESKNKTRAACQTVFDEQTFDLTSRFGLDNQQEKDYIKDLISKDNPAIYIGIILFIAVIVYLLLS